LGITLPELMILQNMDPNTPVAMVNNQTNEKITGDKAPMLKDLETWMKSHPKFKVDMNGTLANLVNPPKKSSTASTSASSSKTNNGVHTNASASTTPAPSTSETPAASLEPGEIPKASTSKSGDLDNVQIPVFLRTGQSVAKEKWPTLKNLQTYLDKNPDANVQSSHVSTAKSVLPKSYHNRLGGENEVLQALATMMTLNPNYFMTGLGAGFGGTSSTSGSSSSAALEAASMQMLLQSMGMGYPYSAMGLGGLGTGLTAGSGLTGANLNQFGASSKSTPTTTTKNTTSTTSSTTTATSSSKNTTTSSSSNSNTASQLLQEQALAAELLSNPAFAQLLGLPSGSSTNSNSNYNFNDPVSQLQALSLLQMLTASGTGTSTSGSSKTEKKSNGSATPTSSKKSLGKIVEDLAKGSS